MADEYRKIIEEARAAVRSHTRLCPEGIETLQPEDYRKVGRWMHKRRAEDYSPSEIAFLLILFAGITVEEAVWLTFGWLYAEIDVGNVETPLLVITSEERRPFFPAGRIWNNRSIPLEDIILDLLLYRKRELFYKLRSMDETDEYYILEPYTIRARKFDSNRISLAKDLHTGILNVAKKIGVWDENRIRRLAERYAWYEHATGQDVMSDIDLLEDLLRITFEKNCEKSGLTVTETSTLLYGLKDGSWDNRGMYEKLKKSERYREFRLGCIFGLKEE